MQVSDLKLAGLKLVTPSVFRDERGLFFESYRKELYASLGMDISFVQDNVSFSCKNTIRGLHFQSTPGQVKLITCLQGEIWDVVVDIRPDSPTFLHWEAVTLDDQSHNQLFIPIGFAHGFCAMSKSACIQYKVSAPYNPKTEKTIRWNDPELNIAWPIKDPILALRDQDSPFLKEVLDVLDCRS